MKELIKIIFDHVLDKKEIPDDLMYEFSQDILKVIQENSAQELCPEFWDFQNYLEMYWRGGKFEQESSPVCTYQLGQLLSYTNIIRDIADKQGQTLSIQDYAARWQNRFLVFQGMYRERGITHKKLARVSNMSPSALSQFVSKTQWDGYYTYRVAGREKYYYLSENGEKLYHLLCEKREKDLDGHNDYDDISAWLKAVNASSVNTDLETSILKRDTMDMPWADWNSIFYADYNENGSGVRSVINKEELYAESANIIRRDEGSYFKHFKRSFRK